MAGSEHDKAVPQTQRVDARELLAELRPPPEAERPRRRPGALRGKIRMAPDFDALPQDVLAALEGGEG